MATYNVTTNFGAKDDLASGNAAKKVKGSEFTTEFNNIAIGVNSKADTTTVNAVTTTANAALPKAGGAMTGAITTNSTFDGRDVATDGTKLDGIEASADVTDATNVTAAGALMDSEVTNLAQVKAFDSTDYATAAQGALAAAALPKSGGAVTGDITTNSTFDGRNVATDGTKLDAIEASADVTDTANVTAAGALMDSEVTNLAQVKAFDSSDYATAAQGTLATNALPKAGGTMSGAIVMGTSKITGAGDPTDAQDVATKAYVDANAGGGGDVTLAGDNTFTGDNTFSAELTANGGIALGDNNKITFGTGADLEIYHSGSDSVIKDAGTGILKYTSNTGGVAGVTFEIENTNTTSAAGSFIAFNDVSAANPARIGGIGGNFVVLTDDNTNGQQVAIDCHRDNGVKLHAASGGGVRLQTTTTGINVTGAVSLSTLLRVAPSAEPSSGSTAGDVYYDSTSNKLRCYNGSAWNDLF